MQYSETFEFNAYQIEIESNAIKDVTYNWLVLLVSRIRFDLDLVRIKFESFTVKQSSVQTRKNIEILKKFGSRELMFNSIRFGKRGKF